MKKVIKSSDWYNKNAEDYTNHVRNTKDSVYHSYYEKPAIYSLLPNLKGMKVLSLGCGSGEDSNYLLNKGAKFSIGVDNSKSLIKIANDSYPKCEFIKMNIEKLSFKDKSFDLVFSSLTLHYLKYWRKTFKEAYRVLKPRSYFIFSCNHPVYTVMENTIDNKLETKLELSITKNKRKNIKSTIGNYLNINPHKFYINKNKDSILNWHKSISNIAEEARSAGFLIENIIEPKPLIGMKKIKPNSYETLNKIPRFIIFRLIKIKRKR